MIKRYSIAMLILAFTLGYSALANEKSNKLSKVETTGVLYCDKGSNDLNECRKFNFLHTPNDDGTYTLCRIFSSGRCDLMPGVLEVKDGKVEVEFHHNLGAEVNGQLTGHLWQFISQEGIAHCKQHSECTDSSHCAVKMNCH